MLGYVTAEGRGAVDALLCEVARRLQDEGVALAGAVQENTEHDPRHKCQMDLRILSGSEVVRISQDLGVLAKGCRLDPDGLERAVGLVDRALDAAPQLMIINKFGKQELEGRGFRPLVGKALGLGIPVIVAMNRGSVEGFQAFAGGMAEALDHDVDGILDWCRAQIRP